MDKGTASVGPSIDELRAERQALIRDRKKIEFDLSEIAADKLQKEAVIFSRAVPYSKRSERLYALKNDIGERRRPLVAGLRAVEDRLHTLNNAIAIALVAPVTEGSAKTPDRGELMLQCLLRIEGLARQILDEKAYLIAGE